MHCPYTLIAYLLGVTMNNLNQEIESNYNLTIKNIITCRDGFTLDTPEGSLLLKPSRMMPGRIMFIHEAKEYLYKNGFKNLDHYTAQLKTSHITPVTD
jgi:spore coat protein I